ncbi:MAG: hypothetical protein ACPGKO_05875 [Pseudohongiellaceae bacterium]
MSSSSVIFRNGVFAVWHAIISTGVTATQHEHKPSLTNLDKGFSLIIMAPTIQI